MGALFSLFVSTTPSVIYAYNMKNYDPMKGQQQKLIRPGAATKLQFSSPNKALSTFTPSWRHLFTHPVYRAASTDYRRALHLGNDRVELDPVLNRRWRAGGTIDWQGGRYVNESPFGGPMTMYDHMKAKQNQGCPCK